MKKIFISIIIFLLIFSCLSFLVFELYKKNLSIDGLNAEIVNENSSASNDSNEINEAIILPNDKTINISVIGDIMCHNTQYQDAYDSSLGDYDFSYVFENIKGYIENADLAIGNLETTLAGKEVGYSSYPQFNTPEHLAVDLKELGIDVLSTANNHSLDTGFRGIENTINELDNVGILHTGTFKTEEDADKLLITTVNDLKIGFLSYTYGTNGIPLPKGKEYCINLINDEKIISDLEKMKLENVDLIITIIHWGIEYQTSPNEEQQRLANLLFDNGADIILGSHPHVLQRMEKREDGKFVVYSLGNFVSGQVKQYTRQSIILNLEITRHYGLEQKITTNATYTPIYLFDRNSPKRYKLLDINNEIERFNNGEQNISQNLFNTLNTELSHIHQIFD